jgi:hypothetical protein
MICSGAFAGCQKQQTTEWLDDRSRGFVDRFRFTAWLAPYRSDLFCTLLQKLQQVAFLFLEVILGDKLGIE